jgi:hypothetical protein
MPTSLSKASVKVVYCDIVALVDFKQYINAKTN